MRNAVKAYLDLEDKLTGKLAKAARSVKSFATDANTSGRATSKWGNELDKFGAKVHNWFGEKSKSLVRGWFTSLKISAALAFAGVQVAIGKAFKDYTEFESTLRNTTGLMAGAGASQAVIEKTFAQFKADIYKLAPQLAKDPQQLATSLYDIVSGGFEGQDATTVLTSATKGGSAGNADPTVVANALVKTLSAYGYEAGKATEITDQMFQSVNLGIISFEELAQQIGDVVGLAATAKVPFQDLMAAVAVMTRKGLVPAEAFTSLNQLMLSIMSPGEQESQAARDLFGKDSEEMWSAKALAAKGLSGVMAGLMETLDPSPDQIKRMQSMNAEVADLATAEVAGDKLDVLTSLFGNVRALRGALVLASRDGYTFADAQEDMAGAVGATDKVLSEQRKSVKFQLDQMKSYFDVFSLQMMEDIAPAVGEKVKQISKFFEKVMSSPEYENAKGFDKARVLGEKVWDSIAGWWEDNKAEVSSQLSKGIDWVSGEVVPKVVDIGFEIGKAVVPAIWKGITNTAPGRGIIAAVALSWGRKLGLGMAGANTGGVGGVGGGIPTGSTVGGPVAFKDATFTGKLNMLAGTTLAVAGAAMAVNELRVTYNRVVDEVQGAHDSAEDRLGGMTTEQLQGEKDKLDDAPWNEKLGMWLWGVTGHETDGDLINRKIEENRQLTTANTIRDYSQMGLLPALQKLWDAPNDKGAINGLLTSGDAKRWNDPGNEVIRNEIEKFRNQDFTAILKQYVSDPTKMSSSARSAVEFLIANSKETVDHISETAGQLYDQNMSQQMFSDALEAANPLLAGVGLKTVEWTMLLTDALKKLDDANTFLETATGGQLSLFGSPYGGGVWQPTIPVADRPSGTGPGWGQVPDPNYGSTYNPTGAAAGSDVPAPFQRPAQTNVAPTRDPDSWSGRSAKVHKNALGSRGMVRKPTLFLAGEAGAEEFNFTPHFKGGAGAAGGSSVTVQGPLIGHVTMSDDGMTIEEIAEALAAALEEHVGNGA